MHMPPSTGASSLPRNQRHVLEPDRLQVLGKACIEREQRFAVKRCGDGDQQVGFAEGDARRGGGD